VARKSATARYFYGTFGYDIGMVLWDVLLWDYIYGIYFYRALKLLNIVVLL
jgi:hypothetical protein